MILDTLVLTSLVGVFVMILELLNLRKFIIPLTSIALIGVLVFFFCYQNPGLYFNNMISYDIISMKFIPVLIITTIFIILISYNHYQDHKHISDYISLKVFILSGAIAMIIFQNLIIFFIGLEILSIGFYALVGSNKDNRFSNESGMKYFLMGSFASAIFLLGMTFIYAFTGTFDLVLMGTILNIQEFTSLVPLVQVGILLMIITLLFKTAVAPFHLWAPDVYQGSPTIITIMLSTISKVAALGAFFKFSFYSLNGFIYNYPNILIAVAILSMLIGSISAIKQHDIKRVLAFSGISNAGFMLVPIILSNEQGSLNIIIIYSISYVLSSLIIFAVLLDLNKQTNNTNEITTFNGLAKKNPFIALFVTISLLSISGIPPLLGFFSKYQVIVLASGFDLRLVIFMIISSVISVYVYFKIIWAMYLKENEHNMNISKLNHILIIIATLFLIGSVLFINLF